MANIKTIALTGAETAVYISGQNCDIRNDGTDIVYASTLPGVTAGADGVLSIPAGGAAKLLDTGGAVYLLGTGSVQLCGNDYSEQVFKVAASASGGGGGTEDTVARTAINTHTANGEIHVTAEEKSAWDSKAEPSDIPTSLPADGGDAETVNGHTVESDVPANAKFTDTTYSEANTSSPGLMSAAMVSKLNGIAAGANKTTVDAALSTTSTNPVQNKIVAAQLSANLSAAKAYADGKLITGSEAASLDNCPEGCWYGQYE